MFFVFLFLCLDRYPHIAQKQKQNEKKGWNEEGNNEGKERRGLKGTIF